MKTLFLTMTFGLITFIGYSQTNPNSRYQEGYTRKNGTYVQPHYKTERNNSNHDNYSTTQNANTYTSEKGHKAKDYSSGANNYGNGRTIYTGSKGGQYYYNGRGNKTYVPKR